MIKIVMYMGIEPIATKKESQNCDSIHLKKG
jgi:hypothetical protein